MLPRCTSASFSRETRHSYGFSASTHLSGSFVSLVFYIIAAIANNWPWLLGSRMAQQVDCIITWLVFSKALRREHTSKDRGRASNLVSVDSLRISNRIGSFDDLFPFLAGTCDEALLVHFSSFTHPPGLLLVSMIWLYHIIGIAFIAAMTFMLGAFVLQGALADSSVRSLLNARLVQAISLELFERSRESYFPSPTSACPWLRECSSVPNDRRSLSAQ